MYYIIWHETLNRIFLKIRFTEDPLKITCLVIEKIAKEIRIYIEFIYFIQTIPRKLVIKLCDTFVMYTNYIII